VTKLLVLWDIDHTLLTTGGVGTEVFRTAFTAATGTDLQNPPDPTGKLEPVLFKAACAENGVEYSAAMFEKFVQVQVEEYRRRAGDLRKAGQVLPGVREVLAALAKTSGVLQSVLSGNTLRAGRVKLEIYSLDRFLRLDCAVGGEDADTRPELVGVAWSRAHTVCGRSYGPEDTVIVGDTPSDVETAQSNRCRLVAVATGNTSVKQLRKAGADVVLEDVSDTAQAVAAILG
jgi:phosphoglycolate phosphatase-like HAD superfamily hydrolase